MELVDARTGLIHDYTRRGGVVSAEIILPGGLSADRGVLWNAAEAAERRKDSRTAREWIVALPAELDADGRAALARSFGVELARRYGVAVDVAVHAPDREGDGRNHHAHILTTTRTVELDEGGAVVLGEKATIEQSDTKRRAAGLGPAADEVTSVRELWESLANGALERSGRSERIDARSLAAQGIDREPTQHLGPVASDMERRGEASDRGDGNRQAQANNVERRRLGEALFKADVQALARRSIPELRKEIERRDPPPFEVMAEQHPAIAPQVSAWLRVQQSIKWCTTRLANIVRRESAHRAERITWEAEGGVWRGFQKIARRVGSGFGRLAASDAWLATQERQKARTEHVRTLREQQANRIAATVHALSEQYRGEIERQRAPMVERHQRAIAVLAEVERRAAQKQAMELAPQQAAAPVEIDEAAQEAPAPSRRSGPGMG